MTAVALVLVEVPPSRLACLFEDRLPKFFFANLLAKNGPRELVIKLWREG